jgi:glycolate oxidase FAD binding subunit
MKWCGSERRRRSPNGDLAGEPRPVRRRAERASHILSELQSASQLPSLKLKALWHRGKESFNRVQALSNNITSSADGAIASRFAIDGLRPDRVVAPQTAEEAGALLKEASVKNWAVVPFGSGSKQHIGNGLKKFDVALSLEHFNQILEFEPQDLVVKVQSGCRLATLQARLAQEGLCLPIDPPWQDTATIGGIVSSHDSGPLRFAHGTIRDYLIGISLIQPEGAWTKFGSRVVKNVTGYDMCKLYTGAFGTLGVLLDFYFKLKPLPPFERTVVVKFKGLAEAVQGLAKLLSSPLLPAAVELLNPAALEFVNRSLNLTQGEPGYAAVLRFGDVENSVQWQVEELAKLWDGLTAQGVIVGDAAEQSLVWQMLREDRPWLEQTAAVNVKLKLNCLPSQVAAMAGQLEALSQELKAELRLKAHAGSGVIRAYLAFGESAFTTSKFVQQLQNLRAFLKPARGTVIVEVAPESLKASIDVWGYDFKDKALMQQIRQQYDPRGILNPGRFVV